MKKRTLCMVYDAVGQGRGSIPKISMRTVEQALDAGWDVTVVANYLDPSLIPRVTWLKLYVPPRLFVVQWLVARLTVTKAIGGRKFDVLHVNQPQVAAIADVFQCHFITRSAWERDPHRPQGLKARVKQWQLKMVMHAEDFYFRHWNHQTRALFDSQLTRDEFHRLYGAPKKEQILLYPFPRANFPTPEEKREARRKLVGETQGIVVGYLGGVDERKGYRQLIETVKQEPALVLLMGGPHSDGFEVPELGERFKCAGMLRDLTDFYAACDVFIVPSQFEPFGLVAVEAAARGLPVIATPEVGALSTLLEFEVGASWDRKQTLAPIAQALLAQHEKLQQNIVTMLETYSDENQGKAMLAVYEEIAASKSKRETRA